MTASPSNQAMGSARYPISVHASVFNHFNQERHLIDRDTYRERRSAALAEWQSLMA
jgi:hypothetical protein